jgi:serine/threonine protein kinase
MLVMLIFAIIIQLHIEIKGFNIIENHQNLSCKIVDFGLARVLSENEYAGTYGGTKPLMAPEIHLG